MQKEILSMFKPRVQKWVIVGGQKWGGSGIIMQNGAGQKKHRKYLFKKKLVGYAALLGVVFFDFAFFD